jgi:pilus assembly protein CpaB
MKSLRLIVPIVIALVIASAGTLLIYRWVKQQTVPVVTQKATLETVPVIVAATDLNWGTKLRGEILRTVSYPKESLPKGFVSEASKVEGRIVIIPLKEKEPVLESKLAPQSIATGGVAAVVKEGKRAVSVRGDKVIGLAGFINPGNRVDVLVTVKDPDGQKETTKIVLEDILVLATGTQVQEKGKAEPSPVDVFTLEVTPEEAERLSLAANEGKIQLALRNITDSEVVLTQGATISKTLASYRGPSPSPAPVAAVQTKTEPKEKVAQVRAWKPREQTISVEVIKGDKVSKQKFGM